MLKLIIIDDYCEKYETYYLDCDFILPKIILPIRLLIKFTHKLIVKLWFDFLRTYVLSALFLVPSDPLKYPLELLDNPSAYCAR